MNNRTIYCRDNLDILEGMDSGSVDLVYLDPPFNTKKVFTAPIGSSAEGASFSDIFRKEDVKDEWIQTIQEDNMPLYELLDFAKKAEGSSSYNYCYLAYMSVRLLELHRVLKDTGSLYLHCDPTMSHYLKLALDCIFGESNFRNEIVWHYSAGNPCKRDFKRKHDVIFRYAKTGNFLFNVQRMKYASKDEHRFNKIDSEGKKYRINHVRNSSGEYKKFYWDQGTTCDDVFTYLRDRSFNSVGSTAKERTGYPTQKPLALLERIIKASSNEGDVVLDPFCGCATTCVAAEKLGRQWIGIDVSHKAFELVKQRIVREIDTLFIDVEKDIHFSTVPPVRSNDEESKKGKYVYIIANEALFPRAYKVGIAKDVSKRLGSYQTSDPNRGYKVLYSKRFPNARQVEKHVHDTFVDNRKFEWLEGIGLDEIIKVANTLKEHEKRSEK